ncbi:hypothetical protein [Adlercreutzia sp. ZJ473]|uniref:hypothetical protein n=1 Tax=Adlercreutzia sp. ZJ473 TaxID=2722822 RepID=UPI00155464D5|nr:hypothetical protein [Adlercreutzia sp. ZJ473]
MPQRVFERLARPLAAAALAASFAAFSLAAAPAPALAAEGAPGALSVPAIAREVAAKVTQAQADLKANRTLPYDPAVIAQIGNQVADGHMICCPGYACAYGDAVITGQATDHSFYGCGCCTWPRWGGGNSSFRSLGSDAALLREAYDEISAGRPTVIHVAGSWGEHWICLIGFRDAHDPDNLTLGNFVALDPVYGNEITASDGYVLYGDACQHVSDTRA